MRSTATGSSSSRSKSALSPVEKVALERSGYELCYAPTEKIGSIIVENYPSLGRLAALRFLEWVQQNPEGVVSLPTGKTPEHFIKEVQRLIKGWNDAGVRREIENGGLDAAKKPELKGLRFVQIDEFYPINPHQHNSFFHYVNRFYVQGFGLDPTRCLLINCHDIALSKGQTLEDVWPELTVNLGLRHRPPTTVRERLQARVLHDIDQWCQEYEERIRSWGGIGFFLGGIGPDGHIGFNMRGASHHSTTRLSEVNYETQAAAAGDLGGIEISRRRLVITIGLATITARPDAVAVIFAAGEAKARIVADSIESPRDVMFPASALQALPAARFYITAGAASRLRERLRVQLGREQRLSEPQVERLIVDLALELGRPIAGLQPRDFASHPLGAILLKKCGADLETAKLKVIASLKAKITAGAVARQGKVFWHTEPHHDDLMLGYLPWIVRNIREHSNRHYFATLTSGFNAVTNAFMLHKLRNLQFWLGEKGFRQLYAEQYFDPQNPCFRNRDVWQYLDGVAADSESQRAEGESRRLLRNLIEVFEETDLAAIADRIRGLIQYFETQYPGKKDLEYVQRLKGMCREWEAECLWGHLGWHNEYVHHLRLGFYKGDLFTEEPTFDRDVKPVLRKLMEIKPDIVSVALDPEGSGPDTHYKVLQAVSAALKEYEKQTGRDDIEVLGYRNIWYRFHPSEANIIVPVSINMFALQSSTFMNTFISQREASFPSPDHDGPFHELAARIQVEQYRMLKTCLGREFFYEHESALMRGTRGFVFLKSMTLKEFYERSRELRRSAENLG